MQSETFHGFSPAFGWRMIFSKGRFPPRIKCGAGFFGIMRERRHPGYDASGGATAPVCAAIKP